jgi:hypothetical protein
LSQYADGRLIVVTAPAFVIITTSPEGKMIVLTANEGVCSSNVIPLPIGISGLDAPLASLYFSTPHFDLITTPVFSDIGECSETGWWHACTLKLAAGSWAMMYSPVPIALWCFPEKVVKCGSP